MPLFGLQDIHSLSFLLFVLRLDDLSFDHISKSVAIERFVIEFRKTRVEVDFN